MYDVIHKTGTSQIHTRKVLANFRVEHERPIDTAQIYIFFSSIFLVVLSEITP
jgi:hypothetical protein